MQRHLNRSHAGPWVSFRNTWSPTARFSSISTTLPTKISLPVREEAAFGSLRMPMPLATHM
jgi:hypothetical protein